MTNEEMKTKIAAMQVKRADKPEVFQAADGTWGHCMSHSAGFASKETAQIDLRFCKEWAA